MFAQRTWAGNDIFRMLLLHLSRCDSLRESIGGLRPLYSAHVRWANMGHPSRQEDLRCSRSFSAACLGPEGSFLGCFCDPFELWRCFREPPFGRLRKNLHENTFCRCECGRGGLEPGGSGLGGDPLRAHARRFPPATNRAEDPVTTRRSRDCGHGSGGDSCFVHVE